MGLETFKNRKLVLKRQSIKNGFKTSENKYCVKNV